MIAHQGDFVASVLSAACVLIAGLAMAFLIERLILWPAPARWMILLSLILLLTLFSLGLSYWFAITWS